jgi:hypothetical protein
MSRTFRKLPHKIFYTCSVPKWFKRMNRQEERAKQNQALRNGVELPRIRNRDAYEYW